ncbi:MAG: SAM-dependent methyltransferase [Burkholderiales bacterium]
MSGATRLALNWIEQGLVPDAVVRSGIRRLCATREREIHDGDPEAAARLTEAFVAGMDASPVALLPEKANEQHYELPAAFYSQVLGAHRKYSACYWGDAATTLDDAEAAALAATAEHAGLADGMRILELGCGWGSLTLWMASHFPRAHITAVSNSHSQRAWIMAEAGRRALRNVDVITADMNHFQTDRLYDRVVSVEMFEHMRNWRALFQRVHGWLAPGGRFLMHVFCHRSTPYAFAEDGPLDWMGRHFFSGGMMPSDELPLHFQEHLHFLSRWRWSGSHYEKTANAWLENLDRRREQVLPLLASVYGEEHAAQWCQRWRVFFMACAELFGYDGGRHWWVSHYLFERPVR